MYVCMYVCMYIIMYVCIINHYVCIIIMYVYMGFYNGHHWGIQVVAFVEGFRLGKLQSPVTD